MTAPAYTLPAATYDKLEAVATRYGGIGHGQFSTWGEGGKTGPCCLLGIAYWVEDTESRELGQALVATIRAAHLSEDVSDSVFAHDECGGKLPFGEWARRIGLARGA